MFGFFSSYTNYFCLLICFLCYEAGLLIKKNLKLAVFNPLLTAILLNIIVIKLLKIKYKDFSSGTNALSYFLTPATVCLAIPMYEKFELLKENLAAILAGIFSGVISSLLSIFILSKLFSLSHTEYVTLLPKSVTTAIGIGISQELGGISPITVSAIILTGVLGNIICETVLKISGVNDSIAKGIAIGTSSHAVGTAKALELGETEGAMSSLAIIIAGLTTVLLAPIFSNFI